jgi:hypothetical protein
MPLCKIRTSKLSYGEIRRITGIYGFPLVAFLKLLRVDFPSSGRHLMPCFWQDMQVPADALSSIVHAELDAVRAALPAAEGSWESHFFQRPHQAPMIADSGGAFFFAPGCRFSLMHVYASAVNGFESSSTYVASFRDDGHTVVTSNSLNAFDPVPGSTCEALSGLPAELIQRHQYTIASMSDLRVFSTFSEFTNAYDRKERLQSDWDLARGAYSDTL